MESIKNEITFLINSHGRTRFQRYLWSLILPYVNRSQERKKKRKKRNNLTNKKARFKKFFEFTIPYNDFPREVGIAD